MIRNSDGRFTLEKLDYSKSLNPAGTDINSVVIEVSLSNVLFLVYQAQLLRVTSPFESNLSVSHLCRNFLD